MLGLDQEESDTPFTDWRKQLEGTKLLAKIEKFLDEYGYRARYDLEVNSPRWREEPILVLKMIAALIPVVTKETSGQEDKQEQMIKKRDQAEETILGKASFMSRRMVRYVQSFATRPEAYGEFRKVGNTSSQRSYQNQRNYKGSDYILYCRRQKDIATVG